jgi:hypothetical protein
VTNLPIEDEAFCFVTASDGTVTGGFSLLGKVLEKFRFVFTTYLWGYLTPAQTVLKTFDITQSDSADCK